MLPVPRSQHWIEPIPLRPFFLPAHSPGGTLVSSTPSTVIFHAPPSS